MGLAGSVQASSTIRTEPSRSSLTLALPSGKDEAPGVSFGINRQSAIPAR